MGTTLVVLVLAKRGGDVGGKRTELLKLVGIAQAQLHVLPIEGLAHGALEREDGTGDRMCNAADEHEERRHIQERDHGEAEEECGEPERVDLSLGLAGREHQRL